MTTRSGSARYNGFGKDGVGHVSTQSGALADTPYGFTSRFEEGAGTNPEELIAVAHASCFTMALSFGLARAGYSDGTLETTAKVTLEKDDSGFTITRSDLDLTAVIDGIDPEQFADIAADAKANCPVSKLLKAEVTLTHRLNP
jgi:osmotically inducible protein OsmC